MRKGRGADMAASGWNVRWPGGGQEMATERPEEPCAVIPGARRFTERRAWHRCPRPRSR